MEYKSILVSWLFETDLTNMNAGEGSSNLKEIKTYNNGLPYISGQSMRYALRQAMKRENPDEFKCTPEYPCGDVENCWTCDLFGFLMPKKGSKRWSTIKASPALGQIRYPLVTDLIFRMVEDIKCPNCKSKIYPLSAREGTSDITQGKDLTCPKCGEKFAAPYDIRQALAHKQLIKNIYKSSISIDLAHIGLEEVPKISNDGDNIMVGMEELTSIDDDKRIERATQILNGIYNLADFANQSREMVNGSPDFVIIGLQKQYNQRLASVLKLDESGNMDVNILESIIKDVLVMNENKIYAGYISGIINNESEVADVLEYFNEDNDNFELCSTPRETFNKVINELSGDKSGGA